MLRSYEYTEQSYSDILLQANFLRDKEIEIARGFVKSNEQNASLSEGCPICGRKQGRHFFKKWQVDYLYCQSCGSIYVICDKKIIDMYQSQGEMLSLRKSSAYQDEITKRRMQRWEEFLEWMQIRAFRFLKRNRDLRILDIGNRYRGYVSLIRQSPLCGQYKLIDSILNDVDNTAMMDDLNEKADIIFYFDQMQQEVAPGTRLRNISEWLEEDGLLVLETRAGSGFDVLTLKEHNTKIYPYEHITLPSVKGLISLLKENNYRVLEVTTPGVMDIRYVLEGKQWLSDSNIFIQNLMEADDAVLQEFQRFLQKNGMSSFVRVIASKER